MSEQAAVKTLPRRITAFRVSTPAANEPPLHTASPLRDTEPGRRLVFKPRTGIVKGSARWPARPDLPDGNDAKTYRLISPDARFYVTIGHYTNGSNHPFEVFANGDAPRGLGPLPWLLSRVMRSTDRLWIQKNLKALQKVTTKPFDMTLPGGTTRRVNGLVAAFATLVDHRCHELGFFNDSVTESPMLAARMCEKEAKGTAEGFTTHSWNVSNAQTGDDGTVTLKEYTTEDGTIVPLSVWFSGRFEPEWEGLAKVLSLQMQISDLSLIATTLQELESYHERNGEYGFAGVPGSDKQRYYPSTLAYVATLLRARYQRLGLFGEDGMPVQQMGLFHRDADDLPHEQAGVTARAQASASGRDCVTCGAIGAVHRSSGCDVCSACGASRCS
ncbi:MAG TPA: hypothetical protein PLN91_00740 [Rhodanobacteraceae bacterium]|nr:hypothetical protein [Rhodanobacteraceae bacterium]